MRAARNFLTRLSPWLILAAIAAVAAGRVALGDFGWADVAAIARDARHLPVRRVGHPRLSPPHEALVDDRLARPPRPPQGAERPRPAPPLPLAGRRPPLDRGWTSSRSAGLITWLVGGAVPWGPLLSGLLTAYILILGYEWTHLLIHTAYVPKSAAYRRIWRNHRLHHFKNENYWHGVTNNLSDTVLGTNPDQQRGRALADGANARGGTDGLTCLDWSDRVSAGP